VAERKRETGYRLEVLFPAWAKPLLQQAAAALELDLAGYVRTAVLRHLADDLKALGPLIGYQASGPGPDGGYQASGPGTGPGPGRRYQASGRESELSEGSERRASGPGPGTPRALMLDALDEDDEASSSSSEEAEHAVPAKEGQLDAEQRAMLDEAVAWREHEHLEAGQKIAVATRWRAAVRRNLLANPEEIDQVLARKDAAARKGRR
jgi:hypothetical protein